MENVVVGVRADATLTIKRSLHELELVSVSTWDFVSVDRRS